MSASAQIGWIDRFKSTLARAEVEGAHLLEGAQADLMRFIEELKQHAVDHPEPIFAILREIKPVLVVKNFALVTRFADVQEVLARDDVFQVPYGPAMEAVTGGQNFFLGMQNSPAYERDVTNMRMAMRREDIGRIAAFVAQTAEGLVAASGGTIDVVALSRTVPVRWIGSYFGTPAKSEQDLADWASIIFQFLFADLNHDPAVQAAALAAAAKLRPWLDDIIAQRKAQPSQADDLLNRCLALQGLGLPGMDDISIRNNFTGLIAGAIPTTSKCCAQAMDELLKRPAALAAAQEAARAGNDPLLAQYVFEALRFNPNNPGLFRTAAEDYTVARAESHATLVPKGTTVLAATQSAMFDGRVIDSPGDFLTGRPDYGYMHFGYGLHRCFGQYVNRVQIPGILKPLLQRRQLRRAAGNSGQLQRTGPFPSRLTVEFDA
ncbi:MAG TPA: cytochrome P450 [Candidatus Angelobacter sp.]|nr:cytochrome P450 [Candidatus Angelobacter sp.]